MQRIAFTKSLTITLFIMALSAFTLHQAHAKVVVIPLGGEGGTQLANVVTVAKSGGQFKDIVAALDSITSASAENPYIIYVAPGTYILDGNSSDMPEVKEHVTIVGAGKGKTIWRGNNLASRSVAEMSNNSGLRSITIIHDSESNDFANDTAVIEIVDRTNVVFDDVELINLGTTDVGDSYGLYTSLGASFEMINSTIRTVVTDGNSHTQYGIYLVASESANISKTEIDIDLSGSGNGIYSTLAAGETRFSFGKISSPGISVYLNGDTAITTLSHSTLNGNPGGANDSPEPVCYSLFLEDGSAVSCT